MEFETRDVNAWKSLTSNGQHVGHITSGLDTRRVLMLLTEMVGRNRGDNSMSACGVILPVVRFSFIFSWFSEDYFVCTLAGSCGTPFTAQSCCRRTWRLV